MSHISGLVCVTTTNLQIVNVGPLVDHIYQNNIKILKSWAHIIKTFFAQLMKIKRTYHRKII
jgi:hypothetical protein